MKNCDEMVNSLLGRRDKYDAEQKRKRKIITRTAYTVCFALAVGVTLWQTGVFDKAAPKGTPAVVKDNDVSDVTDGKDAYAAGDNGEKDGYFCGDYWVPSEGDGEKEHNGVSAAVSENPLGTESAYEDVCHKIETVTVDGVNYVQFEGKEEYTVATCLGDASNFKWTGNFTNLTAKLYTAAEDREVLILKLMDGKTVTLIKVQ